MAPSPDLFHQDISGNIFTLLRSYLAKHPIGSAHIAPLDVYLSEINVYQPDVIFVSNARRSLLAEHGVEGAPDLVVEILSPATARYDKGSKRKIYARTGVKELWLVDPDSRTIQIYELTQNAETPAATHGPDSVFKSRLFPGMRFKATVIFKSSVHN